MSSSPATVSTPSSSESSTPPSTADFEYSESAANSTLHTRFSSGSSRAHASSSLNSATPPAFTLSSSSYFNSPSSAYISTMKPSPKKGKLPQSLKRLFLSSKPLAIIISILTLFYFFFPTSLFTFIPAELRGRTLMRDDPSVPNVFHYDLTISDGHPNAAQRNERVLFLVPLRDAVPHMPMFFGHMVNLTYPHNLIDLAFLVSDSKDDTLKVLNNYLAEIQASPDSSKRFGTIEIYEKDFGQAIGQGFSDRHGFAAQGPRRKLMARARNWLLSAALRPDHSWVYWRDIDVQTVPPTILEDLMAHDKDVIVPNVWRPLPDWLGNEQPYDLNSWQESETGLQLADTLDEDAVIVEGYVEYATWRPHLAYLRDPYGDPFVEMELDGIGGVSILSKASVFRKGAHFPAFSFQKHAETEGFGKMCRRMGLSVIGLPHYVIWHIYEPSSDDIKHMEWMAEEEDRREHERQQRESHDRVWNAGFQDVRPTWEHERANIFKNAEVRSKFGKYEDSFLETKNQADLRRIGAVAAGKANGK